MRHGRKAILIKESYVGHKHPAKTERTAALRLSANPTPVPLLARSIGHSSRAAREGTGSTLNALSTSGADRRSCGQGMMWKSTGIGYSFRLLGCRKCGKLVWRRRSKEPSYLFRVLCVVVVATDHREKPHLSKYGFGYCFQASPIFLGEKKKALGMLEHMASGPGEDSEQGRRTRARRISSSASISL